MIQWLPQDARCLGCGYPLHSLPGNVCPECGRAFDPRDPSTFRVQRGEFKWRRFAGPPRAWHSACCIVLALVWVYGASEPAHVAAFAFPVGCCACFGGALILFANLAFRVYATVGDRFRHGYDRSETKRDKAWPWIVLPICATLIISTHVSAWPLDLRFEWSRAEFEREVQSLLSGPAPAEPIARYNVFVDKWIGSYHVTAITLWQEERFVRFRTGGFGWDSWGFAYSEQKGTSAGSGLGVKPPWFVYFDEK